MHRRSRILACLVVTLVGALPAASASRLGPRPDVGTVWRAAPLDLDSLRAEARRLELMEGVTRVARRTETALTPADAGAWRPDPHGGRTWSLELAADGALWTVVGFTRFAIPEGASVRVLDAGGRPAFGPYGHDAAPAGELWVPPVPGERVKVELAWPAGLGDAEPDLRIGAVAHGFLPFYPEPDGPIESAGGESCNVDINCPLGADWKDEKRGITKMLIGGTTICSGTLVNNTSLDCTPYVLTANHCITRSVASTIFQFFFERPMCGAGPFSSQTVTGAFLEASETLSNSDFALLRIAGSPPAGVHFNGWNRSGTAPSEAWCLHHPNQTNGGVMQIAHRDAALMTGVLDHWAVPSWTEGFVASGSSGAPLFDADGRVVGQLDTGFPGDDGVGVCPPGTVNAQYGKLSEAWGDGLSAKLAPAGSPNSISLFGMDDSFCGALAPRLNLAELEFVGGDGDGVENPGESIELRIRLLNDGPKTATSAVAVLSSPDPDVAVIKNSVSWGGIQIPPASESEGPSTFELKLQSGFVCGSAVELDLNLAWFSPLQQIQSKVLLQTGARVGLAGSPVFADDVEAGAGAGWTTEQAAGTNAWSVSTADAASGVQSWFVQDVGGISDSRLILDPGIGPLPQAAVLRFMHRYETDTGGDGGVLELSIDGGPWEDAAPRILEGGYGGGAIAVGFGSPISGSAAWSGSNAGFQPVEVDLAGLGGKTVRFRWRFASDTLGGGIGWFVDDVVIDTAVYACDTPKPGAICNGFRSGAFTCGATRPGTTIDFPRQRPTR